MVMRVIIISILLSVSLCHALNWTQGAYPDSHWSLGNAELGFGDGDENTVLEPGGSTYYFRRNFLVSALDEYNSLILYMKYDDGFVAYINGVEVARSNMPEGQPEYNTYALFEHEGTDFELFNINLQALRDTFVYTDS